MRGPIFWKSGVLLCVVDQIINLVISSVTREDDRFQQARKITSRIDRKIRQKHSQPKLETVIELIRKNSSEIGTTRVLVFLLLDYKDALLFRKQELMDQEREFWCGNSRPPNHFARTIALRFARKIAGETGARPTFGTARDGGHPSTEFGRALEEIFELLGIKAKAKHPAIWAIDQLTDEDCNPKPQHGNFGFGGLGGLRSSSLNDIVELMLPEKSTNS